MKKILLIDDDEDFCFFIAKNLEIQGDYRVFTSTQAAQAIAMASAVGPDLILLDIMMPGMSGLSLAHRLKKSSAMRSIPIVVVSALDDEATRDRLKKFSFAANLTKPFEIENLKNTIDGVIGQKA